MTQPDSHTVGARAAQARAKRLAYFEGSLPLRWFEGERLRVIREMVAEDPGHRILEIGGGAGHVARMFRRSHLVLLEPSAELVELARRNLYGYDAELLQGDVESVQLAERSFDRIICTQVLEHIENPDAVLERIARLLKPGGRAILTAANGPLTRGVKRVLTAPPLGWALGDGVAGEQHDRLHQWSPDDFRRLVSSRFHVEEQRALPFVWLPLRICYLCRIRREGPLPRGRIES
jgi:2-polyprenyl-3-methyl-5-hydroxy-6-metoxy-1,4-benzoquinol methylase